MRAGLALLALLLTADVAAAAPFDPFASAGIDRRATARAPLDVSVVDEGGKTTTLVQLGQGKPLVLVPVLHDCPNICGVTLSGLAQAIQVASFKPGRDYEVVAFGIDPKEGPREAEASLETLGKAFPSLVKSGGVHAVTGSSEAIAQVTQALGYRYAFDPRISQYAHVAASAVLTADGRLVGWLYGLAPDPTDLQLALTQAGEGRIGGWKDQLLLLCYHYDPVTGRYGPLIWTALRIGGGLTASALAGLVAFMLWRELRGSQGRARQA